MKSANEKFIELNRLAEAGNAARIEKQHQAGKMTARERIELLLDKGTFVEIDKFVIHQCSNFGLDKSKQAGDGVISGYGKIDGRLVYVYAYDFTVLGGSLSRTNANKIVKVFDEDPDMRLLNGRYGVYLCKNKTNYKLPKGVEPNSLSYQDCIKIIEETPKKSK